MLEIINRNGNLYVNHPKYGEINIQDYLALKQLQDYESDEESIVSVNELSDEMIDVDCKVLMNNHPKHLTVQEVLELFVNYIYKYRNTYRVFDIPIGSKYYHYRGYIYSALNEKFPELKWKCIRQTNSVYICRGEYK